MTSTFDVTFGFGIRGVDGDIRLEIVNPVSIVTTSIGDVDVFTAAERGRVVQWLCAFEDETAGTYSSAMIHSVRKAAVMAFSIPSEVGDLIPYTVDVVLVAGEVKLRVHNTGPNTLKVRGVRITT